MAITLAWPIENPQGGGHDRFRWNPLTKATGNSSHGAVEGSAAAGLLARFGRCGARRTHGGHVADICRVRKKNMQTQMLPVWHICLLIGGFKELLFSPNVWVFSSALKPWTSLHLGHSKRKCKQTCYTWSFWGGSWLRAAPCGTDAEHWVTADLWEWPMFSQSGWLTAIKLDLFSVLGMRSV